VVEPVTYLSFLVRLWCENEPAASDPCPQWQGEVEHIQSGQQWKFNSLDELLEFLRRQIENHGMSTWTRGESPV
jgi:hypothetical protein